MELETQICDLFRYIKEKVDTKVTLKVEEKIELKDSKLGSEIEYYRKKKHCRLFYELEIPEKVII